MKKGLTQICLGSKSSVQQGLELCRDLGYSGFEIILTEAGDLTLDSTQYDFERIGNMAEDYNIEITSIAGGGSLCDNDPEVIQKSCRQIVKMLEAAEALGIDTVLTTGGWPGPGIQYDVACNRIEEALVDLRDHAELHRVNIGLENVWNRLFVSPVETRNMLDRIQSDYIGSYFDTGNVVLFGSPEHWLRILGSRIKKIHFKDFKMDHNTRQYAWTQLMQGDVNWPEVMNAIREIGYDGYVITEVCGDRETFAETSRVMDRILELGK